MACCLGRGCSQRNDISITCPPECLQGETVSVQLRIPIKGRHRHDWIGVYPYGVPTIPGISLGRWVYLGPHYARSEAAGDSENIEITLPTAKLPPHHGSFDIRFHRRNGYGRPEASAPLRILRFRISWFKQALVFAILLASVAMYQRLLNSRGECVYVEPGGDITDPIQDRLTEATAPLNAWLHARPVFAGAAQAVSSAALDISMLGWPPHGVACACPSSY